MTELPYFHSNQTEQFTFYRIPKKLFTDERFMKISSDSKILYGFMLDRIGISRKHGLIDKQDRVYIYFTLAEITERLHCAKEKESKLICELNAAGLIESKRRRKSALMMFYRSVTFILDNHRLVLITIAKISTISVMNIAGKALIDDTL